MKKLPIDRPIATMLKLSGIQQSELSRRLNVSQTRVSKLLISESEGQDTHLSTLVRVAKACGFKLTLGV